MLIPTLYIEIQFLNNSAEGYYILQEKFPQWTHTSQLWIIFCLVLNDLFRNTTSRSDHSVKYLQSCYSVYYILYNKVNRSINMEEKIYTV
jgi:hypothetical protein